MMYQLLYYKGQFKIMPLNRKAAKYRWEFENVADVLVETCDTQWLIGFMEYFRKTDLDPYKAMNKYRAMVAFINLIGTIGMILGMNQDEYFYCEEDSEDF